MEEFNGFETDLNPPPKADMGDFSILKKLSAIATDKPEEVGDVDWATTLHSAYRDVAEVNNRMEYELGQQAATEGAVDRVELAAMSISNRLDYLEQQDSNQIKELNEVAQAAIDKIATSSPAVILNNTPEAIAAKNSRAATSASAQAILEKIDKKTDSVLGQAGNLLWQFTPPAALATDYNVTQFAGKYIANASMTDGQSGTLFKLNSYFRTLNQQEQVDFMKNMYDDLRDTWAITDTGAANMVAEMAAGEDPTGFDKAMDMLQLAGIPLTLVVGAGGVLNGMRNLTKAARGGSVEVKLAEVGGKHLLVADTASRLASKGALQVAGALTGATDLVDTARLVTMASAKVLPSTLTAATEGLSNIVKTKVEQTLADLAETLKAKNVREGEEFTTYEKIRDSYSNGTNPEIHSFHPSTADSPNPVVFYKPVGESSYLTKEAAEEALKLKDPAGKMGMQVVPDTTNSGYLVRDEVLNARKAERTVLEARFVEEKLKLGRITKAAGKLPTTPTPPPSALALAKPRYSYKTSQFELDFDSSLDKALYQAGSKSDPSITEWIGIQTGLKGDKLTTFINKEAADIRNFLKRPAAKLAGGTLRIPTRNKPKEETLSTATTISNEKLESLTKEIAFLDEQIAAMNSAKTGLVNGYLIKHDAPIPASTYADLAKYTDEDINSLMRMSFGDWALGTSQELYRTRMVGLSQSSRYHKLLTDLVQKPLDRLSGAEKKLLNSILTTGDKESKLYTGVELSGMGASRKVQEAYFVVRSARNIMHKMRDEAAVRSLTGKGFSQLSFPITLDRATTIYGKPHTTGPTNKMVYDIRTGKTTMYDDSLAVQDVVIYQLRSPVLIAGRKYRTIAAPPTSVRAEPITTVIPFREGEFSRIYSDQYFVKYRSVDNIDGENIPDSLFTHRTAVSKSEGQAYVNAFNKVFNLHKAGKATLADAAVMQAYGWKPQEFLDALDEGKFGTDPRMEVLFNRTVDDYEDGLVSTRQGEFFSERGDRIVNVNGADVENTIAPLDALASELSNTAYMVPLTEWRDVAVNRWFNTVRDVLPAEAQAMAPDDAFEYMRLKKGEYIGNDQMKLFAARHQEYVEHEMNATTRDERVWQGSMRSLSEALEGKAGGKFATTGAMLRNSDVPTFLRTVSFHSFLGGANPIQLVVQGLNAFNAIAISPRHGLVGAKQAALLRMALMSDNPDVWKHLGGLEKLTSLGLSSVDEFADTVKAIRRSGLLDGINSTSLYGAETGKYSLFNKWTRRAGGGSAFFFNRGEEMSRIISFVIAKREWQEANPGKVWQADYAINKMLERQDMLTQTMTRANQAKWQTGIASVPTQFMGYQFKISLNIMASVMGNKRAFSRPETLQLLAAHAAGWGTAGWGLYTGAEEVLGKLTEDWTPEQRLTLNEGLFAGAINMAAQYATGEPMMLAIGSRFNSFGWFFDTMYALHGATFGDGDPIDAVELISGAPGAAIKRAVGNAGFAVKLLTADDQDVDSAALTEAARLLLTGTFSSLNNMDKAYLAANFHGYVKSRAGDPLYFVNENELKALAIGIPPASSSDYEKAFLYEKSRTSAAQRYAKEAGRIAALAFDRQRAGNTEAADKYQRMFISIVKSLEQDPQMARAFRKEFSNAYKDSKHRELAQKLFTDENPNKPALIKPFGEAQ